MKRISIIDKSEEIDAIKKKFGPQYYFNQQANQMAAELWGTACNKHGVVENWKEEKIVEVGSCTGTIQFAETLKGFSLIGVSAQTAIGGFGYAPSVWDKKGFPSYWDARAFGVESLISYFNREAVSVNSCSGNVNRDNADKAVKLLQVERTPQLTLF